MNKLKLNIALSFMMVFMMIMLISIQSNEVSASMRKVTSVYDTQDVLITKSDFTLSGTTNNDIFITKMIGGNEVYYSGSINQSQTSSSSSWFNIKSASTKRFRQLDSSGSIINKWRLTSIELEYALHTSTIGQVNTVKINDITITSYTSVITSTSLTNLNANKESIKYDFSFTDNITTFEIVTSYNLYVSYIKLSYSIDYSIC